MTSLTTWHGLRLAGFLAGLLTTTACGGDDVASTSAAGTGGGSGGASGSGGAGGRGGAGGEPAPAFEELWTRHLSCFGSVVGTSGPYLAVDASAGVALGGALDGVCTVYGGPKVTSHGDDVLVTRLDADGGYLGHAQFGDDARQGVWADAFHVAPGDRLAVGGFFSGTVDFGTGPLTAASVNLEDAYLTVLDAASLGAVWSRSFAIDGVLFDGHVGVDAQGGVVLAGVSVDNCDFGNNPLTPSDGAIYLARFDDTGATTWSRAVGGPGGVFAVVSLDGVAVAPDGSFIVSGDFQGELDFGDGPLESPNDFAPFVASFDASGAIRYARVFAGVEAGNGFAVGLAEDGEVVLGATVSGVFDLGSGPLGTPHGTTGALAKLDAHGKLRWAREVGGDEVSYLRFAVAEEGAITVAATFRGTARVDDLTFESADAEDVLLARLDGAGDVVAAQAFGAAQDQTVDRVAVAADGSIFVTGFGPDLDGTASGAGFNPVFVEKLAPLR